MKRHYNNPTRVKEVKEHIEELCLTPAENKRIMKFLWENGEIRYLKPTYKRMMNEFICPNPTREAEKRSI